MNSRVFVTIGLALFGLLVACKPKLSNSDLANIVSEDGRSAFALVPMRLHVARDEWAKFDPDVAEHALRARLGAVECLGDGAADKLTQLTTTARTSSDAVRRIKSEIYLFDGDLTPVKGCQLIGTHLLSAASFTDIFADEPKTQAEYEAQQLLWLTVRGRSDGAVTFTQSFHRFLSENLGALPTGTAESRREALNRLDLVFNPCRKEASPNAAWKRDRAFSCNRQHDYASSASYQSERAAFLARVATAEKNHLKAASGNDRFIAGATAASTVAESSASLTSHAGLSLTGGTGSTFLLQPTRFLRGGSQGMAKAFGFRAGRRLGRVISNSNPRPLAVPPVAFADRIPRLAKARGAALLSPSPARESDAAPSESSGSSDPTSVSAPEPKSMTFDEFGSAAADLPAVEYADHSSDALPQTYSSSPDPVADYDSSSPAGFGSGASYAPEHSVASQPPTDFAFEPSTGSLSTVGPTGSVESYSPMVNEGFGGGGDFGGGSSSGDTFSNDYRGGSDGSSNYGGGGGGGGGAGGMSDLGGNMDALNGFGGAAGGGLAAPSDSSRWLADAETPGTYYDDTGSRWSNDPTTNQWQVTGAAEAFHAPVEVTPTALTPEMPVAVTAPLENTNPVLAQGTVVEATGTAQSCPVSGGFGLADPCTGGKPLGTESTIAALKRWTGDEMQYNQEHTKAKPYLYDCDDYAYCFQAFAMENKIPAAQMRVQTARGSHRLNVIKSDSKVVNGKTMNTYAVIEPQSHTIGRKDASGKALTNAWIQPADAPFLVPPNVRKTFGITQVKGFETTSHADHFAGEPVFFKCDAQGGCLPKGQYNQTAIDEFKRQTGILVIPGSGGTRFKFPK